MEAPIIPICKFASRNGFRLLIGATALGLGSPAQASSYHGDLSAYLRARAADADGAKAVAASGYAEALNADPANVEIAARAYRAGLAVGDMALVTRARHVLEAADVAPADAALLALAEAVLANDAQKTDAALAALSKGPFAFLVPSASAWVRFQKDPNGARAGLDNRPVDPLAARFIRETRAMIGVANGDDANAAALLKLLAGIDLNSGALRVEAAQFLAHRGNYAEAQSLLAGDDPTMTAYRTALGKGVVPTARVGISRLYLRLAETLAEGKAATISVALARAAGQLEPSNDRSRLIVATALTAAGVPDAALAALDRIPRESPERHGVDEQRVAALQSTGRNDEALAAGRLLDDAPGATSEDAQRLGDLLFSANRFDDAARAYAKAIDRAGADADWALHLQLGGALERAGHWDKAEPELAQAVALAPQSPIALNYLGYAQLEHGTPPADATKLLERASALKPDSASILDSLAWGYFLGGQTARALPLFERAAAGDPANSAINEHLGDVYWASGRYYEARYAWQAAALTAAGEDSQRIRDKIANGSSTHTKTR